MVRRVVVNLAKQHNIAAQIIERSGAGGMDGANEYEQGKEPGHPFYLGGARVRGKHLPLTRPRW